jgi:hypothetical protein
MIRELVNKYPELAGDPVQQSVLPGPFAILLVPNQMAMRCVYRCLRGGICGKVVISWKTFSEYNRE